MSPRTTVAATAANRAAHVAAAAEAAQPEPGAAGFGARLRKARAALGMTAQDLALSLGFGIATIYRWEQGGSAPTLPQVELLAAALEADPAGLAGWKDGGINGANK